MQTLAGHSNFVYRVIVLDNGNFVSASEDKTVRVWNGVEQKKGKQKKEEKKERFKRKKELESSLKDAERKTGRRKKQEERRNGRKMFKLVFVPSFFLAVSLLLSKSK